MVPTWVSIESVYREIISTKRKNQDWILIDVVKKREYIYWKCFYLTHQQPLISIYILFFGGGMYGCPGTRPVVKDPLS